MRSILATVQFDIITVEVKVEDEASDFDILEEVMDAIKDEVRIRSNRVHNVAIKEIIG